MALVTGTESTRLCADLTDGSRASGNTTGTYDADGWRTELPENGAIVEWGTMRLESAGGAWVGGYSGIYNSETGDLASIWFTGTGGYAGLSCRPVGRRACPAGRPEPFASRPPTAPP